MYQSFLKELSKREKKKILSNNVREKSLTEGRIFIIAENFLFLFLVWTFTWLLIIINSISIEF